MAHWVSMDRIDSQLDGLEVAKSATLNCLGFGTVSCVL